MFYNKNNFLVSNIASKDNTRPILTGIKFETNATIATDGYKLMICETPKDISSEDLGDLPSVKDNNYNVIIPKDMVDNVSRSLPKKPIFEWLKNAYFTNNSDNTSVEMITTDGVSTQKHTGKTIEGEYPKYSEVVPKGKPINSVRLNIKYLKQIVDTFAKMDIEDGCINIQTYADLLPVSITAKTSQDQNVQAVIMPVKVNNN